jgi:hypothetical protein
MSLSYAGKISVGVIVPTGLSVVADCAASLALVLPQIAVDLEGAITLAAMLGINPPTLALNISATVQLLADMNIALTASLPQVTFQLSAILALVAQISPIVASLSASLSVSLPFAELLGTAGIQVLSYSGTGAAFGAAVTQELGNSWPDGTPATTNTSGFILASTANPTWVALQTFFTAIPPSQPTGLQSVGSISLSGLCALLGQGILEANLNLQVQLAAIEAQLNGALNIKAQLTASPPSLAGSINIVTELAASLNGYLSLGGFASITVLVDAVASLVASLSALSAKISALISLLASITTSMATAGVLAYSFSGTTSALASALTSSLAGGWPDGTPPTASANALVLGATTSVASAGLGAFCAGI